MSFDEGNNQSAFDYEMKARVKAAIDAEHFTWSEFVETVGYPPADIVRAVNEGAAGSSRNMHILTAIAVALGRDVNWLITGSADAECRFKESLRERVSRLVWEFIYKADVPKQDWRPLIQRIDRLLLSMNCTTERAAYRLGVPRTWKDVAFVYADMSENSK